MKWIIHPGRIWLLLLVLNDDITDNVLAVFILGFIYRNIFWSVCFVGKICHAVLRLCK
jgi:hypothetical protein